MTDPSNGRYLWLTFLKRPWILTWRAYIWYAVTITHHGLVQKLAMYIKWSVESTDVFGNGKWQTQCWTHLGIFQSWRLPPKTPLVLLIYRIISGLGSPCYWQGTSAARSAGWRPAGSIRIYGTIRLSWSPSSRIRSQLHYPFGSVWGVFWWGAGSWRRDINKPIYSPKNSNKVKRKLRRHIFDNMDKWSSKGGKSQRRERKKEEDQRYKSEERRAKCVTKPQQLRNNTFFFPVLCGAGESISKFGETAGAEPSSWMRNHKLHEVVAQTQKKTVTTHNSQHIKTLWVLQRFWKLKPKCTKHLGSRSLLVVATSKKYILAFAASFRV